MLNTYEIEKLFLSEYAFFSNQSEGRYSDDIEECEMRTPFQRDRDRILHSKAFRRLKNKTQVFLKPENDHFRTRLTHTLDVSQIARTIARLLTLNEDLVEAISLGHDLGHTPFGHAGERTLKKLTRGIFTHNTQSLRVVDIIEREGKGLNLTMEVRDGILNHTKIGNPSTLEGKVVHFADRIAYINHDIDDSIRAGILKKKDLPRDIVEILGQTHSERISTMIKSIVHESYGKNYVTMEDHILKATNEMRDFLFDKVYLSCDSQNEERKVNKIVSELFEYYIENLDMLPNFFLTLLDRDESDIVVADYIATMTDNFAMQEYKNIYLPNTRGKSQ